MDEAEKAAAQLDSAFAKTGKTLGLTRSALDGLATEMQRTTTYGDDLVKEAQAILLSFDQVRGEAFERTIKVAGDLSTRLGVDLKSSVRQVGLALQDPVAGLTLLRRAGISFNDSQKNLIKSLLDTGQAGKAQNVILSELERRFGGAAQAARNTLGGALAGLKNAFGDLFEGTKEGTTGATQAINSLADALQNENFKGAVDSLISGLAKIVELAVKATTSITELFSSTGLNSVAAVDRQIAEVEAEIKSRQGRQVGRAGFIAGEDESEPPRRVGRLGVASNIAALREDLEALKNLRARLAAQERPTTVAPAIVESIAAPETVEEVRITLHKIRDDYGDVLREIEESTRTSIERQSAEFTKLRTNLQFLLDEGKITPAIFNQRLEGGITDILGLEEIDLNEIRAKYKVLKKETSEVGEFMKGVWQEVGRSIQSTLSDALYEWRLSWKSLVDITRRALADITAAIITSGIKNALKNAASSGASGGSSGGFNWIGAIAGFFGFAAGGGRTDRPTIVGENGPEIITGTNRVMNQRQMAFAGGGNVTYAPSFSVAIVEREDPERTKAEVYQTVSVMLAQDKAEFVRTLERSGYEVRG